LAGAAGRRSSWTERHAPLRNGFFFPLEQDLGCAELPCYVQDNGVGNSCLDAPVNFPVSPGIARRHRSALRTNPLPALTVGPVPATGRLRAELTGTGSLLKAG
jgi:hypothetical protein